MNQEFRIKVLEEQLEAAQFRIEELTKALGSSTYLPLQMTFELTPAETIILGVLFKQNQVKKESLMTALYADNFKDPKHEKIVDVFVCKLRSKLKKYDVEIATAWGNGYYITLENKDKLRKFLVTEEAIAS